MGSTPCSLGIIRKLDSFVLPASSRSKPAPDKLKKMYLLKLSGIIHLSDILGYADMQEKNLDPGSSPG